MNKSICQNCQIEFTYKDKRHKRFCCNKCAILYRTQCRIKIYNQNKRFCCFCSLELPYNKRQNKFCNSSCAAKYNNQFRTVESFNKQKQSLMKTIRDKKTNKLDFIYKVGSYCKLKLQTCSYCKKMFLTKSNGKATRKTCSSNCTHIMCSIAGKKSASIRTKRSKSEIILYELCSKHYVNVSHNEIILNGWDADIIINDFKLAILWNGPWHYKQLNLNNHSLKQVQTRDWIKINLFKQNGWNVEVFEDRYFTPETAFEYLKTKYE